jgi:hypothetical protein
LILHRLGNVQVLSDGDLGSAELFCQVPDQDPAVPIQDLKDVIASRIITSPEATSLKRHVIFSNVY